MQQRIPYDGNDLGAVYTKRNIQRSGSGLRLRMQ